MKSYSLCPVCREYHEHLVHHFQSELDEPVIQILKAEKAGWQPEHGACTRCLDQANLELQLALFAGRGEADEVNGYKILPTPLRLQADPRLSGKKVTICLIDSGFYPHPDLTFPENRVLAIADMTRPEPPAGSFALPHDRAWHGTMTAVVCAGNGHLSGGKYRALADEARLVLLKVMDEQGRIAGENIVRAIEWAIDHQKKYQIRIINLSVTDDDEGSADRNAVDRAVKRAVSAGITVVAAAGNDPDAPLKAPANSPYAITVGGLNDQNSLNPFLNTLYHSTYGQTADALQKPDLIAPAIWLPAPILPGTDAEREAAALFRLHKASDFAIRPILANVITQTRLRRSLLPADIPTIRNAVNERIGEAKYIGPNYQHADGTSFAAPIVSSLVAQMLEVNPRLDPFTVREILLITARFLPNAKGDRQGWGVIRPAHATQMAGGHSLVSQPGLSPVIDYKTGTVDLFVRRENANSVSLSGDFINWSRQGIPMDFDPQSGHWTKRLSFRTKGIYRYKYLIDQEHWISDPRNPFRESDGYNGFNSKLIIP